MSDLTCSNVMGTSASSIVEESKEQKQLRKLAEKERAKEIKELVEFLKEIPNKNKKTDKDTFELSNKAEDESQVNNFTFKPETNTEKFIAVCSPIAYVKYKLTELAANKIKGLEDVSLKPQTKYDKFVILTLPHAYAPYKLMQQIENNAPEKRNAMLDTLGEVAEGVVNSNPVVH